MANKNIHELMKKSINPILNTMSIGPKIPIVKPNIAHTYFILSIIDIML